MQKMKNSMQLLGWIRCAVCLALLPWAVHAAAAPEEATLLGWDELLLTFFPLILIIGGIFIFWPYFQRRMTKSLELDRYKQHMQNVETQLKRIADALEKRDKDGGIV
jgi:hypothetical protein